MKRALLFIGFLLLLLSCETGTYYPLVTYSEPFSIEFSIDQQGDVYGAVYNCYMVEVRTLVDSVMDAGTHSVTWDLQDESGQLVGEGIYSIEITLDGERVYLDMVEVLR